MKKILLIGTGGTIASDEKNFIFTVIGFYFYFRPN